MARRRGKRARKVTVQPAGRRWIRINPEAERTRRGFRLGNGHVIKPPRIQPLARGFIYWN